MQLHGNKSLCQLRRSNAKLVKFHYVPLCLACLSQHLNYLVLIHDIVLHVESWELFIKHLMLFLFSLNIVPKIMTKVFLPLYPNHNYLKNVETSLVAFFIFKLSSTLNHTSRKYNVELKSK